MFYENYLNSIKPDTSYIPESASDMDKCIFAERAFQDVLNESFFAIAAQEMAIFESVINEADGDKPASTEQKKNLLEIIKKAATTVWEKAKGYYLEALKSVKEKFAQFKKEKGDKIKADFTAAVAKLPKDFVAKGIYDFSNAKNVYLDCLGGLPKIHTYAKGVTDGNFNKEGAINAAVDGAKVLTANFTAEGVKIEKKDAKASDIKSNVETIIDMVFKADNMIDVLKKTYDRNKRLIDDIMKAAKEAMNKNKDNKAITKVAKDSVKGIKDVTSVLTKLSGICISTLKAIRTNYVSLIAKVVVSGKKAVKEDTEISIDVKGADDTDVKVDAPEAEVKDEVEEAFAGLVSEEAEEDDEFEATVDETEGCKSCKEDVDIEVNVEDDDDDTEDDAPVEESALYRALCAYLG